MDVFVAHKDIEPSKEWVEEIHQELKRCDIFIPLLTKNFYESQWTDQESGIAFTHNKKILSIKIDETPRGFINRWQALYFNNSTQKKQRERELKKIFDGILSDFPDRLRESLIFSLKRPHTSTYREASTKIGLINQIQPFSKEEINLIMKNCLENDQIHENTLLIPILKEWVNKYENEIELDLKEKILHKVKSDEAREMLGGKSEWGGPILYGTAEEKLKQLEGYEGERIEEMREELKKKIEKEEKKHQ